MIYNIAIIADVHFGAMPAERLYSELSMFSKELIDAEQLDLIVIAGDLFNNRLSANGDHAKHCFKFIADVFKIAIEKDAKVVFIQGTESHDNDQLSLIHSMKKMTECQFEIFETATKVEILPELNVLMLPEEYHDDNDEFYKPFLEVEEKYDFIFGHGMVDKAAFIAAMQESEFTRSEAPVFSVDKLSSIVNGYIYFGHVHTGMEVNRFRYVSSYTRWSYGESESKGFYMVQYDTDSKMVIEERFIENVLAPRYDTVIVENDSDLFTKNAHIITQELLKFADTHKRDYLRIKIDIPADYPEPKLLTSLLNESFRTSKINLMIINNQKVRQKERVKEEISDLKEKYKIIFDRKADIPSKIKEFIKIEKGRNIEIERIKSLLNIERVRE